MPWHLQSLRSEVWSPELQRSDLAQYLRISSGEAQACQGLVDGVTNGVGQGVSAALNNVAGTVSALKGATKKYRVVRRQGSGAATRKYSMMKQTL